MAHIQRDILPNLNSKLEKVASYDKVNNQNMEQEQGGSKKKNVTNVNSQSENESFMTVSHSDSLVEVSSDEVQELQKTVRNSIKLLDNRSKTRE